jgi:hypothetical protein
VGRGGRAGRIKLMIVLNFGLIKNIEWEMINCAWQAPQDELSDSTL